MIHQTDICLSDLINVDLTLPSFLPYSTCNAKDFAHPYYSQICSRLKVVPNFHRKQWEFVYIIYQLYKNNILFPGAKGLGFGVGSEPLPAFFASLNCQIVATDAPPEVAYDQGWNKNQQYSNNLYDIFKANLIDEKLFKKNVVHKICDMNHIDPDLKNFDFCWSSCCFEHLGSLQAGFDFVINSVEKTLKVGGIACHTTEYNLSSNADTFESQGLSIYRKRDIEYLIQSLRKKGHRVSELLVAPSSHPLDDHIDIPPYKQNVHIKLRLADYICTSIGIVVQRGR